MDEWLTQAVVHRAEDFGRQLRMLSSSDVAVPNLDWTVAVLAQHVASLPKFWVAQHDNGDTFDRPDNFAAFADAQRRHITETNPRVLADLVETEFRQLVAQLGDGPSQRWLYGAPTTATNICGFAINELVLHGRDLAAITSIDPPIYTKQEALASVAAMMVTTPLFIDESKAQSQPDGTYHVRFRGGRDYTWTKMGGSLTIAEGKPARADARLIADPATFLLSSLGRIGQVRAALSGKMIVYGRRPWRFLGLGTTAIDGV